MTSLATYFSSSVTEKDKQEVKESRQKYCENIASLRASCILQSVRFVLASDSVDFCFGGQHDPLFTRVYLRDSGFTSTL